MIRLFAKLQEVGDVEALGAINKHQVVVTTPKQRKEKLPKEEGSITVAVLWERDHPIKGMTFLR